MKFAIKIKNRTIMVDGTFVNDSARFSRFDLQSEKKERSEIKINMQAPGVFEIHYPDRIEKVHYAMEGTEIYLHTGGKNYRASRERASATHEGDDHNLTSPMPGFLRRLLVAEGAEVKKGDRLAVIEAMKMEHSIHAPHDGKVSKIYFAESDQVKQGDAILVID